VRGSTWSSRTPFTKRAAHRSPARHTIIFFESGEERNGPLICPQLRGSPRAQRLLQQAFGEPWRFSLTFLPRFRVFSMARIEQIGSREIAGGAAELSGLEKVSGPDGVEPVVGALGYASRNKLPTDDDPGRS
jgi:hypothetical protein